MKESEILIKKKIKSFLKKENCFEQFYLNFNNQHRSLMLKDLIDEVIKTKFNISQLFFLAFSWYYTQEGDTYWLNIHIKWREYIQPILDNITDIPHYKTCYYIPFYV